MTTKLIALWTAPADREGFLADYEATHALLARSIPGLASFEASTTSRRSVPASALLRVLRSGRTPSGSRRPSATRSTSSSSRSSPAELRPARRLGPPGGR